MLSEEIKEYGSLLKSELNPSNEAHQKLVQKGLLLYRQQLVYQKKINGNTISAKVQDVTPVQVTLELENPSKSHCACPNSGICRHQLALFFSVYSETGSVFEWIQDWKKSDSSFDILKNIKRGRDLLNENAPAEITTGIESWINRFKKAYEDLDSEDNEYVLEITCKNKYRKLIDHAPVEREWKPLYQLLAAYESMKLINFICMKKKINTFKRFFEFLVQESDEALHHLSVSAAPFAFDPYFAYLREDSLILLTEETNYKAEMVELYQMLWYYCFKQNVWRKLEYQRLLELHTNNNENMRISTGLILLSILCGYDEEATDLIKRYGAEAIYFSSYWLKYLKEQKSQNRFFHFINIMSAILPNYLDQLSQYDRFAFMRSFFKIIDEDTLAEHNSSLLEKIYLQSLPHSYYQYSDYLFLKEKYKEWVELQQLRGQDIEFLDKAKLSTIAKSNGILLMPIYHEAINTYLSNRNRGSYKKCVRYLKKLKNLYKKQKNMEIWENFFSDLLENTKRLRAFHEECKRGKLIDA